MVARLFASFFGALMIASAFAYYNYKFAEFKFVDFSKLELFTKNDIFYPKADDYLFIIFNSKDNISLKRIKQLKIKNQTPIILLDYHQKILGIKKIGDSNVTELRTSTNTFLEVIQRFNIYELPSVFFITKYNNRTLYKQDSAIQVLK